MHQDVHFMVHFDFKSVHFDFKSKHYQVSPSWQLKISAYCIMYQNAND